MDNPLLELFNWRISRFLAIGYLRFFFLLSILGSIAGTGFYEYAVARSTTQTTGYKIGVGIAIPFVALIYLLILRVLIEFLISIFYIENHLRISVGRNDDGDIA
jgi:hypothetical protein